MNEAAENLTIAQSRSDATEAGQLADAEADLRRVLAAAPDNPKALELLASVLLAGGRMPEALECYRRADLDPVKPPASIVELTLKIAHAMLAAPGGDGFTCDIGPIVFGREFVLRCPSQVIDYVQIYKNNLIEQANTFNRHSLDGEFGAEGKVLPLYLADWIYKDYVLLKDHLPATVNKVLNIGCGFGGLDVLLHGHYERAGDIVYHLLERDTLRWDEFTEHDPDDDRVIRPLETAVSYLACNGIGADQVVAVASDHAEALAGKRFDLILSLRCWPYLVPFETYLDLVKTTLAPGGVMIVDVSKAHGGASALREHFADVRVIVDLGYREQCLATNPR